MEYDIKNLDEKSYQTWFYQLLFGDNWETKVWIDRNTDGHTAGILFEHKKNIQSYGMAKALSQALIYLARFNRDGIPIPRYTCLVSQDEDICYFIDNNYYVDYINDVKNNAQRTASRGIPSFLEINADSIVDTIHYTFEDDTLYNYIRKHDNRFIKATINVPTIQANRIESMRSNTPP